MHVHTLLTNTLVADAFPGTVGGAIDFNVTVVGSKPMADMTRVRRGAAQRCDVIVGSGVEQIGRLVAIDYCSNKH